MFKKIFAHLAIIFILTGVFTHGYINSSRIPVYNGYVSYAASDNWDSCDTSDLVTAFRYYCKSRNLALQGSAADALTTFTTTTFNNLCSTLGIDPTSLSAELKKTTEGNLGLRFLFSNTGITAYNRIFAEFLQNNDLSVGDEVENKEMWSGKSFNGSIIWILSGNPTVNANNWSTRVVQEGSYFKYSNSALKGMANGSVLSFDPFNINLNIVSGQFGASGNLQSSQGSALISGSSSNSSVFDYGFTGTFRFLNNDYEITNGYPIIYFNNNSNTYGLGFYQTTTMSANGRSKMIRSYSGITFPENQEPSNETVNITTNNNTINNNNYNNNYTIIYNDGDTYISDDDDEPLPTTPPEGGGGGGDDPTPPSPDDPEIPVEPTPDPEPVVPNWEIELPEMPEGNEWLLYGLEKKFPWDIPFNLMFMLSLFAADPETPHFEGTIDLKVVQWDYDIDLAPFDEIAGYVRDFLFIGFLIGLMLITHKLIWG